jgi:heat shock protein HtpX
MMVERVAMYTSLNRQRHLNGKLSNLVQSILLLGGMALLLALLGWSIAGSAGLLFVAAGMLLLGMGPQLSPRVLLRMHRARPLTPHEAPGLYRTLHSLAQRAALPSLPRLYYVPSAMMNAFTVGRREDAAIAVTDGLVRGLSHRELTGVLAHEISHIRNHDTWVMSLAEVVSRVTSGLSLGGQILLFVSLPMLLLGASAPPWLFLMLLICAPTLSALLQLALSRTREYDADLDAVGLTGDPMGLASALGKLERSQRGVLARLFLPGAQLPDSSWLRTHPATTERIRRLLRLQDHLAWSDQLATSGAGLV